MATPKKAVHRFEVVGEVLISFSMDGVISVDSMNLVFDQLRSGKIKTFLATDQGGVEVTSIQRAESAKIVKEMGISIVIITDERIIRGVVTAMSWLGANIKAFSWSDIDKAVTHLQVGADEADRIRKTIFKLRQSGEEEAKKRPL